MRHAEAVLLVDHDQAKAFVSDMLLEDGVGADEDVDAPIRKPHQHQFPRAPLLAPGKDGDVDPDRLALPLKGRKMLPGEDFGWCKHRRLRPCLNRLQHSQQRNQCLARPDVALK